ncbi:MAG: DUF4910 domain-containing protein [Waddliaceae bacterium]
MSNNSLSYSIINDLYLLNRNFCSSDYEKSMEYLCSLLPFTVHDFHSPKPNLGWEIPPKWDLIQATLSFNGQEIFKAAHPLHVIGLSTSFQGNVPLDELKQHLHFDHRDPTAIPYHFRQNYRPWKRTWGFCVPKEFYDSLQPGLYEVLIETKESEGYLKVLEYVKKGDNPESFVFVAHLDHPGMANDDLSGVAVAVEFFKELQHRKTKFSYTLLLLQEIIGSAYYLNNAPREHLLEGCFIDQVGTKNSLFFQQSSHGDSAFDHVLKGNLKGKCEPFRSLVCNDEIVWESFGISMPSLLRHPPPEYHSDRDNMDIISSASLRETVDLLKKLVGSLDQMHLLIKNFQGYPSLSNPQYNLYIDPGQPAFGEMSSDSIKKLRSLMDLIPILPKRSFVEQIARDLQLERDQVLDVLRRWQAKKLIEIV